MDSSPEGPIRSPDAATQYVQNLTAAEEVQDLGFNPDDFGGLFEDVANIPPVDSDIPRIGDPPPRQVAPPITTGIGTSNRQTPTEPPDDLVQQALDEADINTTSPISTGPGTTTRQPPPPPPPPPPRPRRPTATSSRSRARRRAPTATATTTTASRSGARRRRNRQSTNTTTTTAPARGRMQQQLRLLLDDIAADNREISNIVTTNTVTTTYKQNRRRPTVTNTRTRVGNNRRNRPTVSRTSTRVTP